MLGELGGQDEYSLVSTVMPMISADRASMLPSYQCAKGMVRDNFCMIQVAALKEGRIKKPVVSWVSGTCAKLFKSEVQFGHAGAKSGGQLESAQACHYPLHLVYMHAGDGCDVNISIYSCQWNGIFQRWL